MKQTEAGRKEALLVMAHGSPRPIANADMARVVEEVKRRNVFSIVEIAFLECNAPTIPEAIATCAAAGATHILAVPYFLHTGKHVADDLPSLLEQAQAQYPHIVFRLGDYLGRSESVTHVLLERTRTAIENE